MENIKDNTPSLAKLTSTSGARSKDTLITELWSILLYQPPVGIVALSTLTHLVVTGRLFRLYPAASGGKQSVEAVLQKQQAAKDSGRGRSYVLDADDLAYRRFGGIDYIRHKLLRAALLPYYQQLKSSTTHEGIEVSNNKTNPNDDPPLISDAQGKLLNSVWNALAVTCPAGSSRRQFAQDMILPVSDVEALAVRIENDSSAITSPTAEEGLTAVASSSPTLDQLLLIGVTLSEVRMMDTLVRLCRDRLLQRTHRLARKVSQWNRRIESTRFFQSSNQLEHDRLRLACIKAAYKAEIERLGDLVQLLKNRPSDMPEQALLDVLQASELERQLRRNISNNTKAHPTDTSSISTDVSWGMQIWETWHRIIASLRSTTVTHNTNQEHTWMGRVQESIVDVWSMSTISTLSKASFQRMAEAAVGSFLLVRNLESSVDINGAAATIGLLAPYNDYKSWLEKSSQWLVRSRTTILHILQESLKGTSPGGGFDEHELAELHQNWFQRSTRPNNETVAFEIARDWTRILQYVDSLPSQLTMVEGRSMNIGAAAIFSWTRRLNVLGLPLAALQVAVARNVHFWVKPYWPQLRKDASQVFSTTLAIADQRFWVPFQGIYNEIMNQSKGIMSGFGLGLEEKSLDHMLRDLGFGDGTAESRQAALERAATQYEQDLNRGLVLNVASGRLVRLLLVQVQQLKVGMLSALDTIDVLVKGNQIHFQILAAIPAVLITTYGTKLFVRGLYNIRAKDLRPVKAAHAEMTTCINQLECLVLEMSSNAPSITNDSNKDGPSFVQIPNRKSELLGEALFHLHRYLILLDFSSMSVPSRASEDIHRSMLQLLEILSSSADNESERGELHGSDLTRNMQLVHLIKERHEKLKQYF